MWKRVLVIIVSLHLAHVPVPVPDLDGEWQGIAIGGPADPAAWGFVLLGVRPGDDVDGGPFRRGSPADTTDPTGQPFGAVALVGDGGATLSKLVIRRHFTASMPAIVVAQATLPASSSLSPSAAGGDRTLTDRSSPAASRAFLCVWHI